MGNQIQQQIQNNNAQVYCGGMTTKCCDNMSLKNTSKNIDSSSVSCPICYQIFKYPRIMKCKHNYCLDCINDCSKGNTTKCPLCRTQLKKSKGTYGRIDRQTMKKIQKLTLQCRNCLWKGSMCQFQQNFNIRPYFDDDIVTPYQNKSKQEQEQSNLQPIQPILQQQPQSIKQQEKKQKIESIFIDQNKINQTKILSQKYQTKQKIPVEQKQQTNRKSSFEDDISKYLCSQNNYDC